MPNSETKPDFPKGYERWLRENFRVTTDSRLQRHYNTVSNEVASAIKDWKTWTLIKKNLQEIDDKYSEKTGYPLIFSWEPEICTKPFLSFLEKTYRKNIVDNRAFPEEPEGGWLIPPDWFSNINDIVRTTLVVKYLDGVQLLMEEIYTIAKASGIPCTFALESTEEGYYAGHLYLRKLVEIPKINWDTERREFSFEIQVTTQVKDVIKRLLHKYYEERRMPGITYNADWRWNYRSDEFIANYLGHILHYVEGMILEVRDRSKEKKDASQDAR